LFASALQYEHNSGVSDGMIVFIVAQGQVVKLLKELI